VRAVQRQAEQTSSGMRYAFARVRRCPKCDRQLAEVVLTEVTDKGSKSRVTLKLHQVSKETVDALNGEEPEPGPAPEGQEGLELPPG
jgi:hypothetical protein